MGTSDLGELWRLGGATVLFLILLGWVMSEMARLVAERKTRDATHVEEMDRMRMQCQADIDNVRRDLELNLKDLRERIVELESENRQLRERLRGSL